MGKGNWRSGWCINQPNAWLVSVLTWSLSCTGSMKVLSHDPLINFSSERPEHLLTSVHSHSPYYRGFYMWQERQPPNTAPLPTPPVTAPRASLNLMRLGWKWEPHCLLPVCLCRAEDVSVPQAICAHLCVLHMVPHKSLQRIGKGDGNVFSFQCHVNR